MTPKAWRRQQAEKKLFIFWPLNKVFYQKSLGLKARDFA